MAKVLITTVPFGEYNSLPLELLENAGIEYLISPHKKKLTESQLGELISDFDVLIAGTEQITDKVLGQASKLKLISRVGIGLDSVDLNAAKKKGIKISYTPDAPSPAVAELTLGMMLTLIRSVHLSNRQMHQGEWERIFGRRLNDITIGIIGVGRIGTLLLRCMSGFGKVHILANDIKPNNQLNSEFNIEWVTKEQVYKEADIITLHLPLTPLTKGIIRREQLLQMKKGAHIINTSRGGIVNENDLYDVMMEGHLGGAAIDVFENEPYTGRLAEIDRCLLTAHMGSMSIDCRYRMEMEATEEAVRFLTGKPLESEVPQFEYENQG
ncbi:MAG: phosphoglycerate dehydrogenase [Nitrospina sp.]|jgi:D-3-phosphoglycerate dehydrogenase / 2-oxoglutarate reductase|nr:phosphoglycerate dehydrogenase [Nitrospina sp.]